MIDGTTFFTCLIFYYVFPLKKHERVKVLMHIFKRTKRFRRKTKEITFYSIRISKKITNLSNINVSLSHIDPFTD